MRYKKLISLSSILLPFLVSCAEIPISSGTQVSILSQAGKALFKKKDSSQEDHFSYAPLKNKKIESYVNSLGRKLLALTFGEDLIDFHVLRTSYIQGFTDFTDVYVTQGMLNSISNEAELAALLSHEIGHIKLNHAEAKFEDKGKLWDQITREAESQAGANLDLDKIRYDIAYSNFKKDKEEKADEYGAELAFKSGYNPYALSDLFDRLALAVQEGSVIGISNLTGTHKSLKDRAEHLRKYLSAKGISPSGKLSAYEYQSALSALRVSETLTNQEISALQEIASYQEEVGRYQKTKTDLPVKRFTHIMRRVSELVRKYHLEKEIVGLDDSLSSAQSFMQERLIQKYPLWGTFRNQLSGNIAHLLATLGRIGIGFIPVVGSATDLYELLLGKAFLTGENLSPTQRAITATGLLIGQGNLFRQAGAKIIKTAKSLRTESEVTAAIEKASELISKAKDISPKLGNKYVKQDLPALKGSLQEAFEGHIFKGTYEPGELLYQVQRTGQKSPGNWFTPIKPANTEHAEELLNIRKWGNDAGQIKIYRVKERVSGYAGKVADGEGHQFLVPKDIPINDVMEEVIL